MRRLLTGLVVGLAGGWMIGGASGLIPLLASAFVTLCVIGFCFAMYAYTSFWKSAIESEDELRRRQLGM